MNKKIWLILICVMLVAALYACGDDDNSGDNVLGTGDLAFKLEIVDDKGESKIYNIKTDESTVGDALVGVDLIPAEQKPFFSTLDGITAEWEPNENWWAFYIKGEMAVIGAFDAEIEEGAEYKFEFSTGMEW